MGISYYWSVDNSYEFINTISGMKNTGSIKRFDLPLSTPIHHRMLFVGVRSLIIKMFANRKSVSNRKNWILDEWSNYDKCREYIIDKLL